RSSTTRRGSWSRSRSAIWRAPGTRCPKPPTAWFRRARTSSRPSDRRRRSPLDAPRPGPGRARLEADDGLARPERVRRTGHRLDGEAPAGDVGERVTGEQHQVAITLVGPEREAGACARVTELD